MHLLLHQPVAVEVACPTAVWLNSALSKAFALYQKVRLQTAWICVPGSESVEIVCVVCLLWSPCTLSLKGASVMMDYFAVCVCASSMFPAWNECVVLDENYWNFGWLVAWLVDFLP